MQQEEYIKVISQIEKQLEILLIKKCDLLFSKFIVDSNSDELELNLIPLQLRQFTNPERMDFMNLFNQYHIETKCQTITRKCFERTLLKHIMNQNTKYFKQNLYNLVFDEDIRMIDEELKFFKQSVKIIPSTNAKLTTQSAQVSKCATPTKTTRSISPIKTTPININEPMNNTPKQHPMIARDQNKLQACQFSTNQQAHTNKEFNPIHKRRFSNNVMNHEQYIQGQQSKKIIGKVSQIQRSVSPILQNQSRSKSPLKQNKQVLIEFSKNKEQKFNFQSENLGYSDIYKMKKTLKYQTKTLQQENKQGEIRQNQQNGMFDYLTNQIKSQLKLDKFKKGVIDNILQQKTNSFKMHVYNNQK